MFSDYFLINVEIHDDIDPLDGNERRYRTGECRYCNKKFSKAEWEEQWKADDESLREHLKREHGESP